MKKSSITIKLPKPRNPLYRDLIVLGRRVVQPKKGKGSFQREKKVLDFYS